MRLWWTFAVCAGALAAQEIPREEYAARRAELRKSLDRAIVLYGAEEPSDLHQRFFQEPNFLYLSGWRQPGAVMLLSRTEEILFLPQRVQAEEWYTGVKLAAEDARSRSLTGFSDVRPKSALKKALRGKRLSQADALEAIAKLRLVKSPTEIALIERATNETVAGHLAAWKRIRPGAWEYQVAATLTHAYLERGCERNAYTPIVGSGPNSVTLHYAAMSRQMQANETVVMDVGAECSDYATDVTRTVPTSGKFTPRQRELYEIVLGAQRAAIAAVRPGITIQGENSLQKIAYDYINARGLGKYFMHGVGHFVGLDVHDPGDFKTPLQPSMVITIEPGIYIPEENIGIRIEDTIVVTETGARVLSAALPKEIEEVEQRVGW